MADDGSASDNGASVDDGRPDVPEGGAGQVATDGQLPAGYVWAYMPETEPEKPWKAPRWLKIATIAWIAVLVVSGTIYALRGKPTVREQTTAPSAQPTVDRAIGNVVTAAGPAPVVVIGPYIKAQNCKITPVRGGVEYVREVDLYATPGTEPALLHTIATGLPASYAARSGPGNVLDLSADAGDYVGLIGAAPSPGQIAIKAETGCREPGEAAVRPLAAPSMSAAEMAPVQAVLNVLNVAASSTSAAQVPCVSPATGTLRTVSAHVAPGVSPPSLGGALVDLASHPVITSQNVVAYRVGNVDVVATQNPAGVDVSATTRCR